MAKWPHHNESNTPIPMISSYSAAEKLASPVTHPTKKENNLGVIPFTHHSSPSPSISLLSDHRLDFDTATYSEDLANKKLHYTFFISFPLMSSMKFSIRFEPSIRIRSSDTSQGSPNLSCLLPMLHRSWVFLSLSNSPEAAASSRPFSNLPPSVNIFKATQPVEISPFPANSR